MSSNSPTQIQLRGAWFKPSKIGPFATIVVAWLIAFAGHGRIFSEEPQKSGGNKPVYQISPVELFSKFAPAVVRLVVRGELGDIVGSGSGFVVSTPSKTVCHVITNYHVIRAAISVKVEFDDGSFAEAREVISEDIALDLAVLRVELAKPRESLSPTAIDIKNGNQPPIGTRLYAIGSPRGMKNTLSDGLLSGYRTRGSDVTWMQITNPISPGSSGGPVFTDKGVFVGVTTATLPDAQNLNFAISGKNVQEFVARKKNPRPLWKGSCIKCDEDEYLFKHYQKVFERFRQKDSDSELRSPSAPEDMGAWRMGTTGGSPQHERFLEYCKKEVEAENESAIILMGSFKLASSARPSPENVNRINEAVTLLKPVLPNSGDDKFFVLFKIGKAQVSLLNALDTSGTLQPEARMRLLDDAIRTFQTARELRPNFAPTLFQLEETLVLRGRLGEALQVSGQLIPIVPNSYEARECRAEILYRLGSKLAAIDELRVACALNPYEDFAAMRLGDLYTETGQHEKAIEAYRSGLEGDDARYEAALREAEAHATAEGEGEKELSAALIAFAKATHGGLAWQLHCSIARSFVAMKRLHEAIEAYERALEAATGAGQENIFMLQNELAACRAAIRHP